MYPDEELSRLGAHKAALRRRITNRRYEYLGITALVLQPIGWLDWLLKLRRHVAPLVPFAMIPLGLLLRRRVIPRRQVWGAVLRWIPLFLRVANRMVSRRRP